MISNHHKFTAASANSSKMDSTTSGSNNSSTKSNNNKKSTILSKLCDHDVVFGTKGNGRNEAFLSLLEKNSDLYLRLSKFQKMALIRQLIVDWKKKGSFFFFDPETKQLHLAQKMTKGGCAPRTDKSSGSSSKDSNDDDEGFPSTSSKLYTSVRRMMNYVIAKKQQQQQPLERSAASKGAATKPAPRSPPPAATASVQIKKKKKPLKKSSIKSKIKTTSKKTKIKTKSKKTKIKTSNTIKVSARTTAAVSPTPTSSSHVNPIIAPPVKRMAMLVTPEPSPRSTFLPSSSRSPSKAYLCSQRQQHEGKNHRFKTIELPRTFTVPLVSSSSSSSTLPSLITSRSTTGLNTPSTSATTTSPAALAVDKNYIHQLEDSAIHTLMSLSSVSPDSVSESRRYEYYV